MYKEDGIPLDPTYTGKAFVGMKNYLSKNNIENKIFYLFILVELHYFLILLII